MTLETLIAHYGVVAIMVGAGVEGETTVVTGGVLAHQHLIPLWETMLAAMAGSFLADQTLFLLGRYCQHYRWVQNAMRQPAFSRAMGILERHPAAFILSFRFIFGLRTVSPIAVGVSDVPARTYIVFNAMAATAWGALFTLIGYAFGHALDSLFDRYRHDLLTIFAAALVVALIGGIVIHLKHHNPQLFARRER